MAAFAPSPSPSPVVARETAQTEPPANETALRWYGRESWRPWRADSELCCCRVVDGLGWNSSRPRRAPQRQRAAPAPRYRRRCRKAGDIHGKGCGGPGDHAARYTRELYVSRLFFFKAGRASREIVLAAFSVSRYAYEQITRMFTEHWLHTTGELVRFGLSFNGSSVQTRAIVDGLPADVAALALAYDVDRVADERLTAPDWRARYPNGGIVANSLTVLATRGHGSAAAASTGSSATLSDAQSDKMVGESGGGAALSRFADLMRDDVGVLLANPKSAGAARWNFLALWSAARSGAIRFDAAFRSKARAYRSPLLESRREQDAREFVRRVFDHAPVLPRDGREASDTFLRQRLGDVLVTYENEAILSGMRGEALPYAVPPECNCLVEFPISVVDENAREHGVADVSDAFVRFCFSEPAQRVLASCGFRPVVALDARRGDEGGKSGKSAAPAAAARADAKDSGAALRFPAVKRVERVDEHYGGWRNAMRRFFEPGGIFDDIYEEVSRARFERLKQKRQRKQRGSSSPSSPSR